MSDTTVSAELDRHTYRPTRHRGFAYRFNADGSKTYYGYVPGRGRLRLQASGEREARAEWDEIRGKAAKGETIPKRNVRFRDVAEPWFESKTRLKDSTRIDYREALDRVLLPHFGAMRLADIDTQVIASFLRGLSERGLNFIDRKRPLRPLSTSSVENYAKPLNGILSFAVRRRLIAVNPFALLTVDDRPEGGIGKPVYEWSDAEIETMIESAEAVAHQPEARQDYSGIVRLAVFTGLRLGELLGLQWQDVDLDGGVIHVRRQLSKKTGKLSAPKTKNSLRRVPLTAELVAFLRRHKVASSFSQGGDFVFASRTGGPLSHRNVQRRGFDPARKLAGLPDHVTFHTLRHAFASYAAHRGVPVDVLSKVMGHSTTRVTEEVYVHLYSREAKEDAFRAAMGGSSACSGPSSR